MIGRRMAQRLQQMSLRSRVSLVAAGVTAIAVFCVSAAALVLAQSQLRSAVDEQLVDALQSVARTGRHDSPSISDGSASRRWPPPERPDDPHDFRVGELEPGDEITIRSFDLDGSTLSTSGRLDVPITDWDLSVATDSEQRVRVRTVYEGDHPYRVASRGVFHDNTVYGIQAARGLDSTNDAQRALVWVFLLVGLVGIGAALGLGWLVGSAAVGPILRLADAAAHVAETQDLTVQVPETGGQELGRVARSFNKMMATLREARDQQARLVADAGHELRTPLTSLRTNVEVLASGIRLDESDRSALVSDVNEQISELSALVADLTDLAASESAASAEFADLQLDVVVSDAVRRAQRRNLNVTFDIDLSPAWVRGNAHLLERAVLNLCDNAAKWSPPHGQIAVRLGTTGAVAPDVRAIDVGDFGHVGDTPFAGSPTAPGTAIISVVDQGPGISEEQADKVFERFWRAPEARSQPGSGLGLSIVRQVIASHGGVAFIDTTYSGGTRAVIRLPLLDLTVEE